LRKLILLIVFNATFLLSKAQICGTPGLDGSSNLTGSGSINTYYPISGNITLAAGSRSISLTAVPFDDVYGNNFGTKPISAGDMLLVIQMQDATINATNDVLYGSGNANAGPDNLGGTGFTNLGNTGVFEYVIATNSVPMTGGTLTFRAAGNNKGTVNSYFSALETATRGKRTFQVVRIPQYSNLVLSSSIKTPPFNGDVGGIYI